MPCLIADVQAVAATPAPELLWSVAPVSAAGEARRKTQRVEVTLWVEEVAGDQVYLRRTRDLSEEGVFFDAALPSPVGSELLLKITLPGDREPVVAQGRVANVGRSAGGLGVAVHFTRLEGDGLERLRRFLAKAGGG